MVFHILLQHGWDLGILVRFWIRLISLTCWSSAAVAYPLRGLMRCLFRAALLHTTVVMRGYSRDCHLPVSFDQPGPSPLTSLINKAQNCCLLDVFCFSHHTLQTFVCQNPRRSAISEILKAPCLAPTIIPFHSIPLHYITFYLADAFIPRSKSLRSHFFPHLDSWRGH